MNDKGSRADRYHIAVVEQGSFAVAQQFVAEECAGEAGVVSHGEYGAPAFFLDVDDAVPAVHAHVAGLDGDVDLGTFRGSPDDVVTEVEWKFLSVSERVFQYGDVAERGVGVVSMIAIGLHNFPEGIATFMAGYKNISLGVSIALAISLHNIPEGIAVAMPIYYATNNKKKAVFYTFLSGIAEPLGALAAFLILRPFINDVVLGAVFAGVAGIMIYITIEELIPSSRQYGHDTAALLATFAGICLMPLSHAI